jgi:hypothetical protein
METHDLFLVGFANLHQVITTGFNAVRAEINALRTELLGGTSRARRGS